MVSDLASAFILGLIGGAIPGSILTAIFTEILQVGLVRSFQIILLGMLTETIVAFVCLFSLSSLNFPESIFRVISFIGAIILVWLSISIMENKKD